MYGIKKKLINKLQVAQNAAVRLVNKLKKIDNVTTHRKELHWLPIQARIEFKMLTLTWKARNEQAPNYIKELIRTKNTLEGLRNHNKNLLEVPIDAKSKLSIRAFNAAAPVLWNQLPESTKNKKTLNSFKRDLKTYLFRKYYN